MLDSVANFIRQHGLIAPGDRVLAAVSGGSDSLALLEILRQLARIWPFELTAAHLDHGLRGDSVADADFVAVCCARLGVGLETARIEVRERASELPGGLEAAARTIRRTFLRQVAERLGCRVIALGHQRDDQAETVLERLLRGSGATGLAAMRPQSGPFVRPLLECSRQQLCEFLQSQGLAWREDVSNSDPAFTRNRIRGQLLPLLATFNPRIGERLAGLSTRLALEEDFWAAQLERCEAELVRPLGDGLELAVSALAVLHPALRDRLLLRLLARVRGMRQGLLAVHVAAAVGLLESGGPQREVHLPGLRVLRRYDRLEIRSRPVATADAYVLTVTSPGRYPLPGDLVLEVSLHEAAGPQDPWTAEFAADRVAWPLVVRNPRPGDRIALPGGGRQRLKELLRAARLSREQRSFVPLVVADEVLWVAGLRRAPGRLPKPGGTVLRLTLRGADWPTNNL